MSFLAFLEWILLHLRMDSQGACWVFISVTCCLFRLLCCVAHPYSVDIFVHRLSINLYQKDISFFMSALNDPEHSLSFSPVLTVHPIELQFSHFDNNSKRIECIQKYYVWYLCSIVKYSIYSFLPGFNLLKGYSPSYSLSHYPQIFDLMGAWYLLSHWWLSLYIFTYSTIILSVLWHRM